MGGYNVGLPGNSAPSSSGDTSSIPPWLAADPTLLATSTAANPTGTNQPGQGAGKLGYETLESVALQQQYLANQEAALGSNVSALTTPALESYINTNNQMLSDSPKTRMAAEAAPIAGVTQQQNAARQSIAATTPRGGAQDYLMSQSYITQASDIGTLMDNAWNQALQNEGSIGEWGAGTTLSAEQAASSGMASAAATTQGAIGEKMTVQQQHQQEVEQAISMAAMIAAGA